MNGKSEGRNSTPSDRQMRSAVTTSSAEWPLSRISRTRGLVDSTAETMKSSPSARSSARTSGCSRMCSTLVVMSKVSSGKRSCTARTDRQCVRHRVEKVGIAEGEVAHSIVHETGDILHEHVALPDTDPTVVHSRDRAVAAAMHAAARRLDVAGQPLFAVNLQACIAVEWRQQIARGQREAAAGRARPIEHPACHRRWRPAHARTHLRSAHRQDQVRAPERKAARTARRTRCARVTPGGREWHGRREPPYAWPYA